MLNSTRCVFHDNGSYSTICWYATNHFCFFLSFDESFSISTYFLFLVTYSLISYLGNFRTTDHDRGITLCLCSKTHSNGTLFTRSNRALTYRNICCFFSFCQLTDCNGGCNCFRLITNRYSRHTCICFITSGYRGLFCP